MKHNANSQAEAENRKRPQEGTKVEQTKDFTVENVQIDSKSSWMFGLRRSCWNLKLWLIIYLGKMWEVTATKQLITSNCWNQAEDKKT